MHHTYVGSQPIYNNDLVIYAYQLLFRNSDENKALFADSDKATSEVILTTLTDIGLEKLVGMHKACINFTRNFILGEYPIPNIKRRIIIELQEDVTSDPEIIENLNTFSSKGFVLAIPEATYQAHFKKNKDYTYIITVDTSRYNNDQLQEIISNNQAENVKLLAQKIETPEAFSFCNDLGFDYFQGFFFCRPNIVKGTSIPAGKFQLVRILNKLQDEDTDSKELDDLISTDINLSYRLLRYANSSHLGLNSRIESIQHAVTLLGWNTIKMITTLLVLSSIDDKPPELFYFGLIRARLCENLAQYKPSVDKNMAFTAGLLSIVDALLDASMDNVLAQLPLNEKLTLALLNHEGELGEILHDTIAYVHHKPEKATMSSLDSSIIGENYLKALRWANATMPVLMGE